MENKFSPVIVPKEGVSDDFYVIVAIYAKDGQKVEKGDLLLCFETSKAAIEVEADQSGYYYSSVCEGDHVIAGDTLAVISEESSFDKTYFEQGGGASTARVMDAKVRLSKAAQKLIDDNSLSLDVFGDRGIISKSDVEEYLEIQKCDLDVNTLHLSADSLVIYGDGGHAKMCLDIVYLTKKFDVIGMIGSLNKSGTKVFNTPVLGPEHLLKDLYNAGVRKAVLGIGAVLNHQVRAKLYMNLVSIGYTIPNIMHPSASVENSVTIGEGNQIMQGAIIGSDVTIGNNCIINSGCVISHDCVIEDDVHIAPGAILAGGVTVRQGSVVGMGSTIFLGVSIGENAMINNGINIFTDVIDNTVVKFQEV